MTPAKLAAFYRLVGGNYDSLFLETPPASLSFIYQSLGCFHTLQPDSNAFAPPSIPALTPQGFVRWQTVQLLLDPEEHIPFLQAAVKRFEIANPTDGKVFPSILPKETLPTKPDPEVTAWHQSVSDQLRIETTASQAPLPPKLPNRTLGGPNGQSPRQMNEHPMIDSREFFTEPRWNSSVRSPNSAPVVPAVRSPQNWHRRNPAGHPHHRRRSEAPRDKGWTSDNPIHPGPTNPPPNFHKYKPRTRTPSTLSDSSASDADDSDTSSTSDASSDPEHPRHRSRYLPVPPTSPSSQQGRRHSAQDMYDRGNFVAQPIHRARTLAPDAKPPQNGPPRPRRVDPQAANAYWADIGSVMNANNPVNADAPNGYPPGARYSQGNNRPSSGNGKMREGRRSESEARGANTRRYAEAGVWR